MKVKILAKDGYKAVDLNRRRAVREKCLNCSCWSNEEVKNCKFHDCSLHPYREGKGKQNPKDRDKAIRAYCLWCMAGQQAEVRRCISVHCPLHRFRSGRAEKPLSIIQKAHGEAFLEAISHG